MSGIKQPLIKYDFSKLKPIAAGAAGTAKIKDLIGDDNDLDICKGDDCEKLTSTEATNLQLPITLDSSMHYKKDSINNINLTEGFTIYMELDLDLASSNIGFFNIYKTVAAVQLTLYYTTDTITFIYNSIPETTTTFTVNTPATYKTLVLTGKKTETPKLYLDGIEQETDSTGNIVSLGAITKLEIGNSTINSNDTNFTGKIYSFELYDYDISTDSKFDQWLLINTAKNKSIKDLNLEDLYVLNELNKEYERQMDTKQNIAKKEENYYKYKKGNEDLVFRIGFYRNYGNILKKTTIVVHFVLIAIILIIMVYRLA